MHLLGAKGWAGYFERYKDTLYIVPCWLIIDRVQKEKKKRLGILDVGKARKRRSQSSEVCLWKFRAKEERQIYTSLGS